MYRAKERKAAEDHICKLRGGAVMLIVSKKVKMSEQDPELATETSGRSALDIPPKKPLRGAAACSAKITCMAGCPVSVKIPEFIQRSRREV